MAIIKDTDKYECSGWCGKLEFSLIAGGNVKWCHWLKNTLEFPQCSVELSYESAVLGIYSREIRTYVHINLYMNIHNNIIQCPLIDEWTIGVFVYSVILFSLRKEWSTDAYHKLKPWNHYAKRKKPIPKCHMLYDSKIGKSIETEN